MGSVRARPDTGVLFLDFRLAGRRIREYTGLQDTSANRSKLRKILKKVESDIERGTYVPNRYLGHIAEVSGSSNLGPATPLPKIAAISKASQPFCQFAEIWFAECEPQWRQSYRITQRGGVDKYLVPRFGTQQVDQISKGQILAFRAELCKLDGRLGATLSHRRINAIMKPLRQILNEAAERYNFVSPFLYIKPLKTKRTEVIPFSLEQAQRILASVRTDFRPYLTFRFFTGLRSGEVHGLKWKNVDFERRLIFVRQSLVLGEDDDLKTDGSQRDVYMSQMVFDALRQQYDARGDAEYVFTNTIGGPLDNKNFINRVWNPLLDRLGLERRRPYQMRHSAATFWLAAGEAPEWIARQLGHTTTEMLFRVYSRYVPNLTRQDGSAMDRLLLTKFPPADKEPGAPANTQLPDGPADLTP
jgi:integrase